LAFTNNRADCRARSTDFVAMLRRTRILGSHPYRLRRVSRSARRLSVRQSGSPHHPVARRRPSCVMPRIASPNSRTCAAPSGLMQRIRPAFSRASSASILIRRCHPRGFAESHGFRSRSPNPVRHPTSLRTRRCRRVFTAKLDAYDSLTADEHSAISHRNAGILLPRLVPQKDAAPERPIA
jgi:hypothetical protein